MSELLFETAVWYFSLSIGLYFRSTNQGSYTLCYCWDTGSSHSNDSVVADSEPSQRVGVVLAVKLASMEVLLTYLFSLAEV